MNPDRRRDLMFILLGVLLVGGGILVGLLIGGGDGAVATRSSETTVAASPPLSGLESTSTSSSSTLVVPASPSSTSSSSPSPPSAVDEEGPAIITVVSSETGVWENSTYPGCSANPQTATVLVEANDPSGLGPVELEWTVNALGWGAKMERGPDGGYRAVLGPFQVDTVPGGSAMPVDVTVYARDDLGNETRLSVSPLLWLNDCSDQDGPTIQFLQTTESDVWENANYGGCPTQPQTAKVSAIVSDPSNVRRVELEWTVGGRTWSAGMLEIAENVYSFEIGPFDEATLTLGGGTAPLDIKLFAEDDLGNVATVGSATLVTLHDCAI